MTRVEIEQHARALSEEDQVELACALLAPEREREADRRIAAYRRNPSILVAADEARARLKTRAD